MSHSNTEVYFVPW